LIKRFVSGLMLILLIIRILALMCSVQPVKGEWTGTVYIRADGSIDPPDAPVLRHGDVYKLQADIGAQAINMASSSKKVTLYSMGLVTPFMDKENLATVGMV
jgi:hypothetical protein